MSARNRLENKQKRREEREARKARAEKTRALQARLNYLAYAPPKTYDELEEETNKILDEAN